MVFTTTSIIVVVDIITIFITFIWVGLSHGPTNKSWLFALCRLAALYQKGTMVLVLSVPELYQNGLCRAALYQKGTAAGALWRLSSHSTRKMPAAAVEERYYTKVVLDLHQKDAGTPTAAQMLTIYTV